MAVGATTPIDFLWYVDAIWGHAQHLQFLKALESLDACKIQLTPKTRWTLTQTQIWSKTNRKKKKKSRFSLQEKETTAFWVKPGSWKFPNSCSLICGSTWTRRTNSSGHFEKQKRRVAFGEVLSPSNQCANEQANVFSVFDMYETPLEDTFLNKTSKILSSRSPDLDPRIPQRRQIRESEPSFPVQGNEWNGQSAGAHEISTQKN